MTAEYGYELVMIGEEQDRLASPLFVFTNTLAGGLSRWMTANHAATVTPLNARGNPATDAPSIKVPGFAFSDGAAAPGATFAELGMAGSRALRNPVVADYLMTAGQ